MAKKSKNEGLSSTHPQYEPDKVNNYIKQRINPKPARHEFEAAREAGHLTNETIVGAILAARKETSADLASAGLPTISSTEFSAPARAAAAVASLPAWVAGGFVVLPVREYQELLRAAGR